jgi:cephalosporin hydroxylase
MDNFAKEVQLRILENSKNTSLVEAANLFMQESTAPKYSYNFSWLGRPIIQYPQDIVAIQELIWKVKPDLIIETGIAHGGSLILSASILALLDLSDFMENQSSGPQFKLARKVLGIDIDIRPANKIAIENHPLASQIEMIQGSSIDDGIISKVKKIASQYQNVMVILDSNHTHEHVLSELRSYADLTTIGSYCIVFDTVIEYMPLGTYPDRPWDPGNSPKSAIDEFLINNPSFEIDKEINSKLLITVAHDGYLKRVS